MSYDYQSYLKEDLTLQTMSTSSVDERGLFSSNFADSSTVKCRLTTLDSDEEEESRNLDISEFDCYIPGNTSVKTSDRAVISSQNFDILGVEEMKDRFGVAVIKKLRLRRSF
tara:strand:- start:1854 stop:2189 length:336 start_codon:yes stop_codon:yes gene_type:complete